MKRRRRMPAILARREAEEWNEVAPPGSRVMVQVGGREVMTTTAGPATVLGDCVPAVRVEGLEGLIPLTRVRKY